MQSHAPKPYDDKVKPVPSEKACGAKTVMMQRYLSSWQQGHTALTTNWHNQCQTGKPISLQNTGLIKGRKKCKQCGRFRCKHKVFGDILVQEKWGLGKTAPRKDQH